MRERATRLVERAHRKLGVFTRGGSLEPLLSLPVTRAQLIYGKIAATCLFMTLSLALSLVAFYFALGFMPLEQLGMTPNFGPGVVRQAAAMSPSYGGAIEALEAENKAITKRLDRVEDEPTADPAPNPRAVPT